MKLITVLGTRPEIIRMACIIKELDKFTDNIIVHTGQNYDKNLRDMFFDDLDLRYPDIQLNVKSESLHDQIGNIIKETGRVFQEVKPDAVITLGDTNSALSLINARRMKIPSFHIEAGDRSFDINVPEELNRKIVDHTANINIAYTEYSRRNLLAEGIHPSKIFVCGSPIKEVYDSINEKIEKSNILKLLNLKKDKYIVASIHREENVDTVGGLEQMVETYNKLADYFKCKIIVSTHPRTKIRLKKLDLINKKANNSIIWHDPFGLIDFLSLQINSLCVVSDSGTIHEDSCVLGFAAVAIRRSSEKFECIDSGFCPFTGLDFESILPCLESSIANKKLIIENNIPLEYLNKKASRVVTNIVLSHSKELKKLWHSSY